MAMRPRTEAERAAGVWSVEGFEQRLFSHAVVDGVADCWQWMGAKTADGYGRIMGPFGNVIHAHRAAFEVTHQRRIVLSIDHLCRNRACVNPAHLEEVSIRENILRGENRAARQFRQTHCRRGHALSGDNLMRCKAAPNKRYCRACNKIRNDEKAEKKRQEARR